MNLRERKGCVWTLAAGLLVAAGAYLLFPKSSEPGERFRFESVVRGDIEQIIHANGTLNPVSLVKVGTQVSGTLRSIHADFNDRVRAGQVLARLDPVLFEAAVASSEAALHQAEATLAAQRAHRKRTERLVARAFLPPAQLDEAERALQTAEAGVALARAQLRRDRANLAYTAIRSPVDGVVVTRNVDAGQTVAAAFQTPTLFLIAQDLREMQIDTAVSEADVGGIRPGMPVRFRVDAYPHRSFSGEIKQLRLIPTTQQGVVSYNVVIAVDNRDAALLPGMTAHVEIPVGVRRNVLRIPNAALRFQPGEALLRQFPPGERMRVFRLRDDRIEPVIVETGISDGVYSELTAGDLAEGDSLVVRELSPQSTSQPRLGLRFY